jgi:16S rRNA G966 N2-methylase RsmD
VPEKESEVVKSNVFEFVRKQNGHRTIGWDICFYDPPYATAYAQVLNEIGAPGGALLNDGGVLIAEHHHKAELADQAKLIRRWRIVKQGESCLSFYERD